MGVDIYDQPYKKPSNDQKEKSRKGRPYLSIYWKCCGKFSRIYKNREGTAYKGRCMGCGSILSIQVGSGGVSQRTFIAE